MHSLTAGGLWFGRWQRQGEDQNRRVWHDRLIFITLNLRRRNSVLFGLVSALTRLDVKIFFDFWLSFWL